MVKMLLSCQAQCHDLGMAHLLRLSAWPSVASHVKLVDEPATKSSMHFDAHIATEVFHDLLLLSLTIDCLQVSAAVARAVAQKAYDGGYATALPKPHNLVDRARQAMYSPQYRRYR